MIDRRVTKRRRLARLPPMKEATMTRVALTRLSQLFTSASERCRHTHLGAASTVKCAYVHLRASPCTPRISLAKHAFSASNRRCLPGKAGLDRRITADWNSTGCLPRNAWISLDAPRSPRSILYGSDFVSPAAIIPSNFILPIDFSQFRIFLQSNSNA